MREINEILERVTTFGPDDRGILATVVDVQGSGYRLPGARMLMLENGQTFGMVSGGCLEADVMARAKNILQTNRAEVFTYDTSKDLDSVFSLNMGCRGVVRIMLEPIERESPLVKTLISVRDDRKPRTIATVISSDPMIDSFIGKRAIFGEDYFDDQIESAELEQALTEFRCSEKSYSFTRIETPETSLELAIETLHPPVSLLLFGAGADAIPVAKIAAQLGWEINVFDHRPAHLTTERFPEAKRLVLHNDENPIELPAGDSRTVAVVMTHNYQHDARIIPSLLRARLACIAALGPKRRTTQLLEESSENFTSEKLEKLYAPAGLDIGAQSPEAIALSIVAEIQSVLSSRGGGHLRDRDGSIYDRK